MAMPSVINILKLYYAHSAYIQHLFIKKIRFYRRFKWIQGHPESDDRVPPPLVYKLNLTLKCNLKCKMCMFWGEAGWCHRETGEGFNGELEWGEVKKIICQVKHYRPSFIISGGEPLLYSHFKDLAGLLKEAKCFAYICTNGLLLDRFKDVISENYPYLTFLVSLDGLEKENDVLRGSGVYNKVIENIKALRSLKRPPYMGVQFTIRPENIDVMQIFCMEMAKLGVNWILLNPCWFISKSQAGEYEKFLKDNFCISPKTHLGYLFSYNLDKDKFIAQLQKIRNAKWPMQIACYLDKPEDIYAYMDAPGLPTGNSFCYKQWMRLDITPEGDVVPCIQFPDLSFGNIKKKNILEIWNSEQYRNFRNMLRKRYLPLCSKCDAIYLYDSNRKYL